MTKHGVCKYSSIALLVVDFIFTLFVIMQINASTIESIVLVFVMYIVPVVSAFYFGYNTKK